MDSDPQEVFIVGGGPSLRGFDFFSLLNKKTIVVNKAILNVPNPNYFITVDYTFILKIGLTTLGECCAHKYFVVDLSYPFIQKVNDSYIDTRHNLTYTNLYLFDTIIESKDQNGLGFSFEDFRSGANSGYSALQLAVVLGFKKINLLGIDLICTDRTHFHEGYGERINSFNEKLESYFQSFKLGLESIKRFTDIRVVSRTPFSRLNDIIPFEEM